MAARPPGKQRPYLLRAMHEWMTDNALTPHIVVNTLADNVSVPFEHAEDGRITLNVSYAATRGLVIDNEFVRFEARFGGVPRSLEIPVDAVLGIYAREDGQGMVFTEEQGPEPPPEGPDDNNDPGEKRPTLRVVK